jgi:pyruvate,water dikinase
MIAGMERGDPVHTISGPATRWTTVNFAEAIQGVQTPLSWSVWSYGMETSCRRAFGDIGALTEAEVPVPASPDERMSGIFFGRAAGNIDVFRKVGDRMPGSNGDILEEKLFGKVAGPTGRKPLGLYLRYPLILTKLPRATFRAPRALPGLLEEYRAWWRAGTLDAPPRDLPAAQRLLRESAERFARAGVPHTVVSMIGPQLLDTLTTLAEQATGDASLGMDLATGFGGMEETAIIADIWEASQGRLTVAEIQRRHGFHGPDEGRLDSDSWREDASPVETLMRNYATHAVADPREREREQVARRAAALDRVLVGLPAVKRPAARLAVRLAGTFIPARELGKAAFLHTLDAARCAARAGGEALAEQGLLDAPDDVFFLTMDEFTGALDGSARELVAERKERHARYETLALPPSWQGMPEPVATVPDERASAPRLAGIGVVGSVVTGRARVVHDPATAELEPGDILVCATTDPSWTPLFMLAEALVIDTGGQMSHGAIVARELGVTCVINTVTGTRDIPDGATITVDGATGVVDIAVSESVSA